MRFSGRSQEATLLSLAAIMTIASNGFLQEQDPLVLLLKIVSGQQIFFLTFQFLGQYQLLSFMRHYIRRNIAKVQNKDRVHHSRRHNKRLGMHNPMKIEPLSPRRLDE